MYDVVRQILEEGEFSVIESFDIPPSPARYAPIPEVLRGTQVGAQIEQGFGELGLWTHQAEALERLGRGENVVVSTGTASGKSLIFQSFALQRVLEDPSARVIVFYPLRALVEDQFQSWTRAAAELGLGADAIGLIYGPTQMTEREEILKRAHIVVMTPDVCQAWLMKRVAMPAISSFVRQLSTLVLDEAHTMEGVFGSNSAFLLRRLVAARNHLLGEGSGASPLQLIAATATIADPADHMKLLTGESFSVISHEADGAERHIGVVAHIASPEGQEISVARDIQRRLLADGKEGGFITFLDSRKGVETLAMATEQDVGHMFDDPAVASYRAGFDQAARRSIEQQLRNGMCRGVVSTSALELGIDFPHLRVGLNVGVPPTRKAYRQRLGRVGRRGPGAFLIIGPADAFRRYGMSLEEYHSMSVEPSYLYLDNRFMQFAHGRCLADELEALGASASLPSRVGWPSGFEGNYRSSRPGGQRDPEFDAIAELGADDPHRNYPLRNVGEFSFDLKRHENSDSIGDVTQPQALRECYPGGTYLHGMRSYEVLSWNASSFSPYIRIRPMRGKRTTPHIVTWINTGNTLQDIVDKNLKNGEDGFLAECRMQITERVDGFYNSDGNLITYQELQKFDPNMKPKVRNFRTTGVVFSLDEEWFKNTKVKREFSDVLREIFLHTYSILPHDVGNAATNISIRDGSGTTKRGGCIAVFDQTYGSLRLTEKLFTGFEEILRRLEDAPADSSAVPHEYVAKVLAALKEFSPSISTSGAPLLEGAVGQLQVFAEGSRVVWRQRGATGEEVEVIEPTMRDGELMYRVKTPPSLGQPQVRRFVPAAAVEPSAEADSWNYAWWNSATETYVPPGEEDA